MRLPELQAGGVIDFSPDCNLEGHDAEADHGEDSEGAAEDDDYDADWDEEEEYVPDANSTGFRG